MIKIHIATLLVCALGLPGSACAEVPPPEDAHYPMYLVYRIWIDDLAAQPNLVTEELELAHQEHIKGFSRTAMSSNVHDTDGNAIGVVALNAFDTRADVDYYIYEDPYTRAGLYQDIRIIPVEVDFVDAYFSVEPDWVRGEGLDIKHRRYERDELSPTMNRNEVRR